MAANHTRWDSRGLSGVYRRLLDGGVDFVVVGGQAINLWAEHYQAVGEPPGAAWEEHLPFASGDLDLFGSTPEVLAAEAALGITSERRADPFGKAWTPAAGTFHMSVGDGPDLMIHFLHTVHGLNSDDVELTALTLIWGDDLRVRVLHPMLCLEGKLANLRDFAQDKPGLERQDHKHVRLAALSMCAALRGHLAKGEIRPATDLIERVMRAAGRQEGLNAWSHFGLCLEEIVPIDALRAAAQTGSTQAANFLEKRWDQLQTILTAKRDRMRESLGRQGREPQRVYPLLPVPLRRPATKRKH